MSRVYEIWNHNQCCKTVLRQQQKKSFVNRKITTVQFSWCISKNDVSNKATSQQTTKSHKNGCDTPKFNFSNDNNNKNQITSCNLTTNPIPPKCILFFCLTSSHRHKIQNKRIAKTKQKLNKNKQEKTRKKT